jgi:predicted TPR repeat methyltransferase
MSSVLPADAVGRMLDLYRAADEAASEALCREILAATPAQPEALLMQGVFEARRGRFQAAAGWFGRAIGAQDDLAPAHINLGHALDALGRYGEAAASYRRAIELGLVHAHVLVRLGSALERCGDPLGALEAFDRALELDPVHVPALYERVDLLIGLGRDADAVATLMRGRAAGADAERIDYALAALGHAAPVAASPAGYVRDLFDGYADGFESHLVGHLRYGVPEAVADLLDRLALPAAADIVDLGCGTGLCGPALRVHAGTLVGVDLSARMLDRARGRGCYDELHCDEIGAFVRRRPGAFDLAVAADVLIYFGELSPLLAAVHAALRPLGRFVFSVESSDDVAVVLQRSRRFAHSHAHVLQAAEGFVVESAEPVTLRRERGVGVAGRLYALMRGDAPAGATGS